VFEERSCLVLIWRLEDVVGCGIWEENSVFLYIERMEYLVVKPVEYHTRELEKQYANRLVVATPQRYKKNA